MYVNPILASNLSANRLLLATFSTMVGGVISDIYNAAERNAPMSCFSGAALFGTGLGPLVSGFIERRATWRWIYYSQAIVSAVFLVILAVFLKETRGSVLLSRKAKVLNRYYEKLEDLGYYGVVFSSDDSPEKEPIRRVRWKVKSDEERETLVKMVTISCYRPFHLLFTEPVVFFFSLWVAFSWAILYLQLSTIPLVFSTNHGFNIEQSGAVFSGEYCAIHARSATDPSSYLNRIPPRPFPQHIPGEDSIPTWKNVQYPGRPTLLRLRRVDSDAHRVILVRMDFLLLHSLDRACPGDWMRHHGDLLHLPSSVQLPCRYVSSIRQLRDCGAVFLPKYASWYFPTGRGCHVHQSGVPGCFESFGWDCMSP